MGFFSLKAGTGSGYNPSWRQRGLGLAAALQGRDYRDPEEEAYLEEQRIKKMFGERLNETEKGKDLDEARGIRHLTTMEVENSPQLQSTMPGVVLSTLTPDAQKQIAKGRAEKKYAKAASEKILSSLLESTKAEALLPKAGTAARVEQGREIAASTTGELIQQALGSKTKATIPFTTAMGEAEARAELAKSGAMESGSRLTTAENLALQEAGIPALSAIAKEAELNAGAIASKGKERYGREALSRDLPERQAQTEATKNDLTQITAEQDIEDMLTNREGQQELIASTIKAKNLDALSKARLAELQIAAMQGDLTEKEKTDLRNISLGLYRAATEDKLNPLGRGMPIRTPQQQAQLDYYYNAINEPPEVE